ncbi:NAD-dependent epimerase/dehydratase family protein [Acidimicrobiaceae bacterium]|nr:NAD-dependent epimerase/dehydratase family protein [Acidimicrobiaceae bacterium]
MVKEKIAIVTGSDGLVGSEAVKFFSKKGFKIIGIDNNSRKKFFGDDASILKNRKILKSTVSNYIHLNLDINSEKITDIFKKHGDNVKLVIHAAAQPSHDWAASNPRLDFNVNAYGTLNLLENTRIYSKDAVFIYTSTNKVYGDNPNKLKYKELKKRYSPINSFIKKNGIDENFSIDNTLHSLFGVSKLSADVLTQEYGKYFDMKTVSFRGGCLTGGGHAGTELHGFLSYLVKCLMYENSYTIFGFKGKQVRDNIHSSDLIKCFYEFYKKPRLGEVYNIGGGVYSNCSMLEAIEISENLIGKKLNYKYIDKTRKGDHQWYVSDLSKFKSHYPNWKISLGITDILEDIVKNT